MARLDREELLSVLHVILNDEKKRNFVQSVDIQIRLKNFDVKKNKRFAGSVKLPHIVRTKALICVLADVKDADRAKKLKLDLLTVDQLKGMKKDKKKVKSLAKAYTDFFASKSIIRKIPRLLGPGLSRAGKFPSPLLPKDDLAAKVKDINHTVKFQVKKEINLATSIGSFQNTAEQLCDNIIMAVNFLATLCPRKWQNIGQVVVKSTMGKPHVVL